VLLPSTALDDENRVRARAHRRRCRRGGHEGQGEAL